MKIMTILGTRPEIIRLCRIIPKLDEHAEHILVHTGQNYDASLKDIFFNDLGVRAPDHYLGAVGSFGQQVAVLFPAIEKLMCEERPDRLLILGDTNSGLAAVVAKRLGIPVYHMEAGNRCYDDRVPEEVNRRIIDHSSDVLMPYTDNSRRNLLAEGIPGNRIYVTGNPIKEVLDHYEPQIAASTILAKLGLVDAGQKSVAPREHAQVIQGSENFVASVVGNFVDKVHDNVHDKGPALRGSQRQEVGRQQTEPPTSDLRPPTSGYFLVTMHREENVDVPERLACLTRALEELHESYGLPVVVSTHPRTRNRMEKQGVRAASDGVRFLEPFGFFDFVHLEQRARCVLSDSGTVQEECCIFGVPNVTLRDVTERPETIECGSNILAGCDPDTIQRCVSLALTRNGQWVPPREYLAPDVSDTVARIVLGYRCIGPGVIGMGGQTGYRV